jgi:hypothetical protein
MLERIATVITAIVFIGSLLIGFLAMLLDLVWTLFTGHSLTSIDPVYIIALIICTPPVSLILMYLGQGLDYVFKTKRG